MSLFRAVLSIFLTMFFFLALLSGCAQAPQKQPPEIVTEERCYHYMDLTPEQWQDAIDWLEQQRLDYAPALIMEDYVRIRSINECEDAEKNERY